MVEFCSPQLLNGEQDANLSPSLRNDQPINRPANKPIKADLGRGAQRFGTNDVDGGGAMADDSMITAIFFCLTSFSSSVLLHEKRDLRLYRRR